MSTASGSRSQISPRTVWTVGLNILAILGLLLLVRAASGVLSWVLVALFLALAASPLVSWLQRKGLRRGVAVALVFLTGLGLVAALLTTFVPMLVQQGQSLVREAPDYIEQLKHQRWVEQLDARYDLIARVSAETRQRLPGAAMPMLGVVTDILHHLAAFITVVVLTLFFLCFGKEVFDKALLWLPPPERGYWRGLALRMHHTVGSYVAGAFCISLIGGGVTMVTLLLLGVPYFVPLGLAMAVLGLVPFLGPLLGGVLVVATAYASGGNRVGLIALGVFLLYQQVENHLLQPIIQRHTLRMSPLLIALAMLVGTAFAGVLGALLALPVAGAVQVVAQDRLARRHERWIAQGLVPTAKPEPPHPPEIEEENAPGPRH
ncbi:AI-2E family transporter [Stigmatella aurantiaca]|uniref:Conserved uncharacterized protein n=1 Tax=Stigmatella aurantiaca (strain DW4/3-1) TaxID=378806 RepID=Q096H4_STIAD|nr:AI-2E family transporter [Stigmatella aurantiaca]ADO68742.1 conserved uncharacterized protein [Stigmatella aurantiaca DW4/3-1]EAU67646.1 hypothetical protein STIAU_0634 [Stigmatella aurantiaca DW4/3-1]